MKLQNITTGVRVDGLCPDGAARIIQVEWFGTAALKVTFERPGGGVDQVVLGPDDEERLGAAEASAAWAFGGDGEALRLALEARRIRLAHLFDPYLAVYASRVEPLPHQITAVYGEMLGRQPLRFLLADDPGAGKTIMAGLLIKELMIRGDLERCLIVAPGNLVEQWHDELVDKFGLKFDILTRDQVSAAGTGNAFAERGLLIARLDMLARAEDLQMLLRAAPEFDLIVCDEAHRMSATRFGDEVKETARHRLGRLLGERCRHFLLMTATPHNGKDEDFQLFMSLLDADRFAGRQRRGAQRPDVADLMRRLTKEELRRFDGTPLFPERRAYTARYELSPAEAALYAAVTEYVRQEMNRADRIGGDNKRRQNVGFALQVLQRRLASSPEAIWRSLSRRRARLEARLAEEETRARGGADAQLSLGFDAPSVPDPDDLDEAPEEEVEELEATVLDQATAARTLAELRAEIASLRTLETQAGAVRRSGQDAKWRQLDQVLDDPLMTDGAGHRRKLIVFTEPRDTLEYLAGRIHDRLGRPEAVVVIHGGVGRDERRRAVEAFLHDPAVSVLVANDAAGEGVNLQRAHLMVNYDLPWNPNRLEQRFGRIHRIGQTEVCHLWNLVASGTREGDVYARLLEKLEVARAALGGRVYDVLGQAFEARPLRDLLLQAIRYGDDPTVRARLHQAVDGAVDRQSLTELLARRALVRSSLSAASVEELRRDMERAAARRLQPHFLSGFFLAAFRHLGGRVSAREAGRWELTHVPAPIRRRSRETGRVGEPVLDRYERVCFDKDRVADAPPAKFISPGHPLLDSVVDLVEERHAPVLKQGAVLVDERDGGATPRALAVVEHAVRDGRTRRDGRPLLVSQRLQFIELHPDGRAVDAGPAPYLDYRPATVEERAELGDGVLRAPWLAGGLDRLAEAYAIQHLAPEHLAEVRRRRLAELEKEEAEVEARLKREVMHWDTRAADLRRREGAGERTRLSAAQAAARADDLAARLQARKEDLARQRTLSALPPVVVSGALVVPIGLLRPRVATPAALTGGEDRGETERLAMDAVMAAEQRLGWQPRDVSALKLGYDVESWRPANGAVRFIEVKGRVTGADEVVITRNEILVALNRQEQFVLAIAQVRNGSVDSLAYVRRPFGAPPDFGSSAVIYRLGPLLERGEEPS